MFFKRLYIFEYFIHVLYIFYHLFCYVIMHLRFKFENKMVYIYNEKWTFWSVVYLCKAVHAYLLTFVRYYICSCILQEKKRNCFLRYFFLFRLSHKERYISYKVNNSVKVICILEWLVNLYFVANIQYKSYLSIFHLKV